MEPTLPHGTIVATRPTWRWVRRGDVVVLRRPGGPRLVKRVAAMGGDLVELEAGRLSVNGVGPDGPRVAGAEVTTWTVPAHHLFVVGDNRWGSSDSRSWADPFIPDSAATGTVLGRIAWRA